MPDIERITELTLKYKMGSLTAEEKAELDAWLSDETNRVRFEQRILDRNTKEGIADLKKAELLRESNKAFISYPADTLYGPARVVSLSRSMRRRLYVSAAVVLLIIAGGLVFWRNQRSKPHPQVKDELARTDIAPGGDKATLTLGDGSKIDLDRSASGFIAQQADAKISKLSTGELAYAKIANEKPIDIVYNTLATPRGGQYHLILPDGTKVWLNSASSIKYPTSFTGGERKVEVIGEAYIEVVHNARMPFKVQAQKEIIEDIGTAFNINAYADEPFIKTTLVEGSVRISLDGATATLNQGQQAQVPQGLVTNAAGKIKVLKDVDVSEVVSWKNGITSFRDDDIKGIMRKVSRWYDVDVRFQGDIPEKKFMGGIPRDRNLSELLKILELSNIHFELAEGGKALIVKP